MKKILSVALILIMMLSVFSIPASAEAAVWGGYYDAEINDLYYTFYDNEAYVVGYEVDPENPAPAGEITIPEEVTYRFKKYTVTGVETEAFYQSMFTSITLPDTINYIGDYAFSTCDYLENVVVPDDCYFDYFGYGVFVTTPFEAEIYSKDETIFGQNVLYSYIGNADKYVIPERINTLTDYCFFMSGVKSVVINENITDIPYYAFASCRNLKEITIPDSVEYISEGAFKDCTSLEKVTLGENVSSIGLDAFSNTKLKSIHLGQAVYEISGAFRDCKTLETITVDAGNTALSTDGNAVYFRTNFYFDEMESMASDYDLGYILEYYLPTKAKGTVTLRSDVTMIGDYAFYGYKDLKEVKAKELMDIDTSAFANSGIEKFSADSVTWIYDGAFKNCKNLTEIDLTTTEYIGMAAFENCTSLTEVEFNKAVYEIGGAAFSNTGLKNVAIYGEDCWVNEAAFKGCKELESVRLEEGVSYVGMDAFLDCPKLKTIFLSKTVESFEENAFNGCDNVTFEVIKYTDAYDYVDDMGFDYEVVGKLSLWERIVDFFRSIFFWL